MFKNKIKKKELKILHIMMMDICMKMQNIITIIINDVGFWFFGIYQWHIQKQYIERELIQTLYSVYRSRNLFKQKNKAKEFSFRYYKSQQKKINKPRVTRGNIIKMIHSVCWYICKKYTNRRTHAKKKENRSNKKCQSIEMK